MGLGFRIQAKLGLKLSQNQAQIQVPPLQITGQGVIKKVPVTAHPTPLLGGGGAKTVRPFGASPGVHKH